MGKIKAGGRDVVGSGAIVTHPGDKVIELSYENLNFWLIVDPPSDGGGAPVLDFAIVEDRLEIRLRNFDNALGSSWSGDVGKIGPRKLYLSFSVHTIGTGENMSRTFNYTFSLGGAIDG